MLLVIAVTAAALRDLPVFFGSSWHSLSRRVMPVLPRSAGWAVRIAGTHECQCPSEMFHIFAFTYAMINATDNRNHHSMMHVPNPNQHWLNMKNVCWPGCCYGLRDPSIQVFMMVHGVHAEGTSQPVWCCLPCRNLIHAKDTSNLASLRCHLMMFVKDARSCKTN